MSDTTLTLAADDKTAAALVATIRAAVNGAGKYSAYVTAHEVTRETVKFHAAALAALAYPSDAPVQKKDGKRTRFGNAVQAAGNGLRAALGKTEPTDAERDYIKAIIKAVDNGVTHNLDAETILAVVTEHVATLLS